MHGGEPASFGIGEPFAGKCELREVADRDADPLQPLLDASRQGALARPWFGCRRKRCTRVGEQARSLVASVEQTVGGDQRNRLAHRQRVLEDGSNQEVLMLRGQRQQRKCHRRLDPARRHFGLALRREVPCQQEALRDPLGLAAKQSGHGALRQAVLLDERAHDASLVDHRQRPRRRIGGQDQSFGVGGAAHGLDDGGDRIHARRMPALEAFEAIDDLEGSVFGRHHADGQAMQATLDRVDAVTRAQFGVGGAHQRNGKMCHAAARSTRVWRLRWSWCGRVGGCGCHAPLNAVRGRPGAGDVR